MIDPIRLAERCRRAVPDPAAAGLLAALNRDAQAEQFALVWSGAPWYRTGGVMDADNQPVAADLHGWIEAEYTNAGRDFERLLARWQGRGLQVTRYDGRTHYLVAPSGPQAADFLQLEVEETVPVIDRPLLDEAARPDDLDSLIDPPGRHRPGATCGTPVYALKRVTAIGEFIAAMDRHAYHTTAVHRFLNDWDRASCAARPFCRHWVFKLQERSGSHGEVLREARPVSTCQGPLPQLDDAVLLDPAALATRLRQFDRAAGYPLAWYFFLVRGKVPAQLAERVQAHIEAGYRYLPEVDIALLAAWRASPYRL